MNNDIAVQTHVGKPGGMLKNSLIAGLLAGILDGFAAIIDTYIRFGVGPANVFKFISSGVFGKDALVGGSDMVVLGIFFHLFIACSWALLFFVLFPKLGVLQKNKIIVGIIYGLLIWLFMNRVVLPLSNTPKPSSFNILHMIKGMAYVTFLVGLPISILANRYYRQHS